MATHGLMLIAISNLSLKCEICQFSGCSGNEGKHALPDQNHSQNVRLNRSPKALIECCALGDLFIFQIKIILKEHALPERYEDLSNQDKQFDQKSQRDRENSRAVHGAGQQCTDQIGSVPGFSNVCCIALNTNCFHRTHRSE